MHWISLSSKQLFKVEDKPKWVLQKRNTDTKHSSEQIQASSTYYLTHENQWVMFLIVICTWNILHWEVNTFVGSQSRKDNRNTYTLFWTWFWEWFQLMISNFILGKMCVFFYFFREKFQTKNFESNVKPFM